MSLVQNLLNGQDQPASQSDVGFGSPTLLACAGVCKAIEQAYGRRENELCNVIRTASSPRAGTRYRSWSGICPTRWGQSSFARAASLYALDDRTSSASICCTSYLDSLNRLVLSAANFVVDLPGFVRPSASFDRYRVSMEIRLRCFNAYYVSNERFAFCDLGRRCCAALLAPRSPVSLCTKSGALKPIAR